jgi:hypothetical protein
MGTSWNLILLVGVCSWIPTRAGLGHSGHGLGVYVCLYILTSFALLMMWFDVILSEMK